jgi:LacI family transcriptional regulator
MPQPPAVSGSRPLASATTSATPNATTKATPNATASATTSPAASATTHATPGHAPSPNRLLDVANAAGVSLRTASRVLNDDPRVASVTRQRVREVMLDLSFQPDAMARSLRAGTDTAIGFVVESISDPFFADVIDAVELEMSKHGRAVLVASTRREASREHDVVGRMFARRVAGLLLSPTAETHSWLAHQSAPVVLVDRPAPGLSADLVEIDDRQAAFDAVSHLIAYGHRRIAYVGDTPAIPTSAARLRGYRDALAAHQIAADEELVRCDGATTQAAANAAAALINSSRPPTAILSATTRASFGVVPALHAGRRTDIALVAFGDFPMADSLRPAITVVDHPGHEVGRVAAARLLARLAAPELPVERIQVPARIIARGSGELTP